MSSEQSTSQSALDAMLNVLCITDQGAGPTPGASVAAAEGRATTQPSDDVKIFYEQLIKAFSQEFMQVLGQVTSAGEQQELTRFALELPSTVKTKMDSSGLFQGVTDEGKLRHALIFSQICIQESSHILSELRTGGGDEAEHRADAMEESESDLDGGEEQDEEDHESARASKGGGRDLGDTEMGDAGV